MIVTKIELILKFQLSVIHVLVQITQGQFQRHHTKNDNTKNKKVIIIITIIYNLCYERTIFQFWTTFHFPSMFTTAD